MPDAGKPAPKKKSPAYRISGVVLGVVLVLGIVGAIPQFASYRDAWTAIQTMSQGCWAASAAVASLVLAFAVWPFQAALPRLRFWPGFMQVQTSTAVATTVPAGGAVALGLTYRMFGSFGFSEVAITSAVMTTGIWRDGHRLRRAYRKVMLTNTRFFFAGVLLPFLSGAFCFWVGYEVIKQSGAAASASVLVAMALGVPLIVVARRATRSDFFHRGTIAYDSIEPPPV